MPQYEHQYAFAAVLVFFRTELRSRVFMERYSEVINVLVEKSTFYESECMFE